jgi:hypothetical protein
LQNQAQWLSDLLPRFAAGLPHLLRLDWHFPITTWAFTFAYCSLFLVEFVFFFFFFFFFLFNPFDETPEKT